MNDNEYEKEIEEGERALKDLTERLARVGVIYQDDCHKCSSNGFHFPDGVIIGIGIGMESGPMYWYASKEEEEAAK